MNFQKIRVRNVISMAKRALKDILSGSELQKGSRSLDANQLQDEQVLRFREVGLDWEHAQVVISRVPDEVRRRDQSEHYSLFAAWLFSRPRADVLEVGTDTGQFAAFLSALVPEGRVVTIDLPTHDSRYRNASVVSSHNPSHRGQLPNERTAFLNRPNVTFVEMNSINLADTHRRFDAIWLDGDHTNPVVTLDISEVVRLVKPGGLLAMDDIRLPGALHGTMGYDEAYQALEALKTAGVVNYWLIHKRVKIGHPIRQEQMKYIAIVQRVSNKDPLPA